MEDSMILSGLLLFIITNVLASLTPGPASVLSIQVSFERNRYKIIMSALGITAAGLIYGIISLTGLGIILATSEKVFMLIKTAGSLFLVYLGVTTIFSGKSIFENNSSIRNSGSAFIKGFFVGMGNINAILFFIAVFPQLFDIKNFSVTDYVICLSFLIVIIFICMICYSLIGLWIVKFLKSGKNMKIMDIALGAIFISLGVSMLI
jgi:homoserine/homoserine lactone efflux protein